ncbi:11212_t:CDS:2 [Diversispora eburnea]|uniref:11212_t:CDS:1 n=1 Tax=Diversispora eburnea TaxID=1213867 RepID=A0A9N9C2V8_9GLOM|nr:11212_t:CDS:2 [Diversispora eburnea]
MDAVIEVAMELSMDVMWSDGRSDGRYDDSRRFDGDGGDEKFWAIRGK